MALEEIVGFRINRSSHFSAPMEIVFDELVDVRRTCSGAQQLCASRIWNIFPERELLHVKNVLNDVLLVGS